MQAMCIINECNFRIQQNNVPFYMERETEQKEKIRRAQTLGVAISWAFYLLTWVNIYDFTNIVN